MLEIVFLTDVAPFRTSVVTVRVPGPQATLLHTATTLLHKVHNFVCWPKWKRWTKFLDVPTFTSLLPWCCCYKWHPHLHIKSIYLYNIYPYSIWQLCLPGPQNYQPSLGVFVLQTLSILQHRNHWFLYNFGASLVLPVPSVLLPQPWGSCGKSRAFTNWFIKAQPYWAES